MAGVIIVGAQWGDEGKGKIVDLLAEKADVTVRFNGGDNAGHTVIAGEKTFKFRNMPSGVLYPQKRVVIGNGCVINPKTLLSEIDALRREKIEPNLLISAHAHIILPYHIALDGAEEERKGKLAAGTTKKGIGPCYSDKAARFGLRFADLLDKAAFKAKLHTIHELKVAQIEKIYGKTFAQSEQEILAEYSGYADQLAKFIGDAGGAVNDAMAQRKNILFEGAQGTLLDIDHGVYPYGTSSNTTAGGACTGAGVGPNKISEVVGVVKVYTSRVGTGPLPTEISGDIADKVRDKGNEYGTNTGRARRIGWLDVVALKYARDVNGLTGLAFTRIDTLAGVSPVKLCVAYELDGEKITTMPQTAEELARCTPVYEEMPGWAEAPPAEWRKTAIRGMFAVPEEAKNYMRRISEYLNVPICIVSIGAGREDTIVIKDVFPNKPLAPP